MATATRREETVPDEASATIPQAVASASPASSALDASTRPLCGDLWGAKRLIDEVEVHIYCLVY
jgi:hypothetical protein